MTVSRARDVFDYAQPRAVAALLAGSTDGRRDRLLDALGELCASRPGVSSGRIDLSRAVAPGGPGRRSPMAPA
ncbi:hypothetical protein [Acrocarpospora macrocephala]|uniref:hypothetical protein n=1 Tax=Acrocarpospora macrocephala TaxID=150177 RepID=UPI0012D31C00|nr:hypothetical protein [Acrocarpospora macrocephala]